jgi:hypothetical protein
VVPPLELILKQSLISARLHTIPRCDSEGWCAAWMGTRGGDTRIEMWSRWWPLWEDLSLNFLTGAEYWQFERGPCMQFSPNIPCYFCTCRHFKLQMEFCAIFCRRLIRDRVAGNRNEFVCCLHAIYILPIW